MAQAASSSVKRTNTLSSGPTIAALTSPNVLPELDTYDSAAFDWVEAFTTKLLTISDDDSIALLMDAKYDGFSAGEWRKRLLLFWRSKLGNNDDDVMKCVIASLALLQQRGTKLKDDTKIKKKFIATVLKLRSMGLDTNPSKGRQPSDKITLGRFGAGFPYELSTLIAKTHVARVVGYLPNNGYPAAFCHTNFPSLIPTDYPNDSILVKGWRSWRDSFLEVITRNQEATAKKAILDNASNYEAITRDSDLYPDNGRRYNLIASILVIIRNWYELKINKTEASYIEFFQLYLEFQTVYNKGFVDNNYPEFQAPLTV